MNVSLHFAFCDSDIIYLSTDNVRFRVHRKNVEMHSNMLTTVRDSTHNPELESDVFPLPESSNALELLFRYMYNEPQPDLRALNINVLLELTDAAEKYQVYSALGICSIHVQNTLPNHAMPILKCALKHKNHAIANEAARHTLGIPLRDIEKALKPELVLIWVKYYMAWMDLLRQTLSYRAPVTSHHWEGSKDTSGARPMPNPCEVWTELWATFAMALQSKPENLFQIDEIYTQCKESLGLRCTACECWMIEWKDEAKYRISKMPCFTSFL